MGCLQGCLRPILGGESEAAQLTGCLKTIDGEPGAMLWEVRLQDCERGVRYRSEAFQPHPSGSQIFQPIGPIFAEFKLHEDGSVLWDVQCPNCTRASVAEWIGPRSPNVRTRTLERNPYGSVTASGPRAKRWVAEEHSDGGVLVFGVAVLVVQPANVRRVLDNVWNVYSRGKQYGEGNYGQVFGVTKIPHFKVNDDVEVVATARRGKVRVSPTGCFGKCELVFSDGLQPAADWFFTSGLSAIRNQYVAKVLDGENQTWTAIREAQILQQMCCHEEFPGFEGLYMDGINNPVIVMEKLSCNLLNLFTNPEVSLTKSEWSICTSAFHRHIMPSLKARVLFMEIDSGSHRHIK